MSADFRAVKEEWGEHSSVFVGSDNLICVLREIAQQSQCEFSEESQGESTRITIENGTRFLAFLSEMTLSEFVAAFPHDDVNTADAGSLLGNMQVLLPNYRAMINKHGQLEFLVD